MVRWFGRVLFAAVVLLVAILLLAAFLPGQWLARGLEPLLSRQLQAGVDISGVNVAPFGMEPQMELSGLSVGVGQAATQLAISSVQLSIRLEDLMRGDLVLNRLRISDADLVVNKPVDASMSLQSLLAVVSDEDSAVSRVVQRVQDLPIRDILLDTMSLRHGLDRDKDKLDLRINGAASTHASGSVTRLQLDGQFLMAPMAVTMELPNLHYLREGFPERAASERIKIDAVLGDSRFSLEGDIGEPDRMEGVSLQYALDIVSSEDWQRLLVSDDQAIPAMSASGRVERDSDVWQFDSMQWQLGSSDVAGELRLDRLKHPTTIDGSLSSDVLHLDELSSLAILEGQVEALLPSSIDETISTYGHLLNRLRHLEPGVRGRISYRADRVEAESWPVTMLDVQAAGGGEQLLLIFNSIELERGLLEGTADIDMSDTQTASALDLNLKRYVLTPDIAAADTPGSLTAHLDLRILQDMNDSLSVIESGRLQALAAGGDVSRALIWLMGMGDARLMIDPVSAEGEMPVRCSYADLQFDHENVDIATLVGMTGKSVVLGDGSLSWHDRMLDLALESHSMDGDAVSAWSVQGTLQTPDRQAGSPVLGRDTAKAVLADIVTPAVQLMPFLDARGDTAFSDTCSGLANALQGAQ